jgi:hypothetical protein
MFRDADDVAHWVAHMTERGFPLPNEVPDQTFTQPIWMPRHDH